jgi:phosphomevalonate kinase
MMASAPGKLVLSGAYVVLDGAIAVTTAVDRRAYADSSRAAGFVSPELRAAFGNELPPYVDSSELREGNRKLGLGSSAACLVATLGVHSMETQPHLTREERATLVCERAFHAHRKAQGGGSGIDIVTATWGGTLACVVPESGTLPEHTPLHWPEGLVVEAWVCPVSSSTSAMLGRVRSFKNSKKKQYRVITKEAIDGAALVHEGFVSNNAHQILQGTRSQANAMARLGDASGANILSTEMRQVDEIAKEEGAVFAQAGAGGGDVALYFGVSPSSERIHQQANQVGLHFLAVECGSEGLRKKEEQSLFINIIKCLLTKNEKLFLKAPQDLLN